MKNRIYTWSLWKCCPVAVFSLERWKFEDSNRRLSSFNWWLPELQKVINGSYGTKNFTKFWSKYETKSFDLAVLVGCILISIHFSWYTIDLVYIDANFRLDSMLNYDKLWSKMVHFGHHCMRIYPKLSDLKNSNCLLLNITSPLKRVSFKTSHKKIPNLLKQCCC